MTTVRMRNKEGKPYRAKVLAIEHDITKSHARGHRLQVEKMKAAAAKKALKKTATTVLA